MNPLRRRELLAAFLGAPIALSAGCARSDSIAVPPGDLVGASADFGHRLRTLDPQKLRAAQGMDPIQARVVIVGGGIAGLAAARRLESAGVSDFTVLELENGAGGNSRSARSSTGAFPWGAHYVPVPPKENEPLVEFFEELGAFEGRDEQGQPIPQEHWLVRDPESRVFYKGVWYEGLYLHAGASTQDVEQFARFQSLIDQWTSWRDAAGRRAFTIPVSACSDDTEVMKLDQLTMSEWLLSHDLNSPRLHWYVNYACRDDYGLTCERTSAWAGIFYFAARRDKPGADSQPFLTWPEGNGYLVKRMFEPIRSRTELGWAACSIRQTQMERSDGAAKANKGVELLAVSSTGEFHRYLAERVIFAAPRFLAPFLIRDLPQERRDEAKQFQYGSWAVVNLHLTDRPQSEGFPLCWDNVIYESPGLGYVTSTHQRGADYGPTILTYYYPLCGEDLLAERRRLLHASREDWAEIALSDLEKGHANIRELCSRADVARWGHAMICPTPGFISGSARRAAAKPFEQIHFAHSDLSGVSLFEEAFDHGWRAGGEVAAALGGSA